MEFKFNVNDYFGGQNVVKINPNLVPPGFKGDRRQLWESVTKVSEVINAMGEASATAQGLSKPITTADRLRNSEQSVYLLIDKDAHNGKGAVTGMLKTGKKGLYVFDRNGHHYQVSPPCILDFYVHESKQRQGLGKQLFEHMLKDEKVDAVKLAIDRPSEKLLGFMNKHYGLQSPVKQMNNFVVFDEFFPKNETNGEGDQDRDISSRTRGANGLQNNSPATTSSSYGRYGAPRPHCSMGQIIHNQTNVLQRPNETGGVVYMTPSGQVYQNYEQYGGGYYSPPQQQQAAYQNLQKDVVVASDSDYQEYPPRRKTTEGRTTQQQSINQQQSDKIQAMQSSNYYQQQAYQQQQPIPLQNQQQTYEAQLQQQQAYQQQLEAQNQAYLMEQQRQIEAQNQSYRQQLEMQHQQQAAYQQQVENQQQQPQIEQQVAQVQQYVQAAQVGEQQPAQIQQQVDQTQLYQQTAQIQQQQKLAPIPQQLDAKIYQQQPAAQVAQQPQSGSQSQEQIYQQQLYTQSEQQLRSQNQQNFEITQQQPSTQTIQQPTQPVYQQQSAYTQQAPVQVIKQQTSSVSTIPRQQYNIYQQQQQPSQETIQQYVYPDQQIQPAGYVAPTNLTQYPSQAYVNDQIQNQQYAIRAHGLQNVNQIPARVATSEVPKETATPKKLDGMQERALRQTVSQPIPTRFNPRNASGLQEMNPNWKKYIESRTSSATGERRSTMHGLEEARSMEEVYKTRPNIRPRTAFTIHDPQRASLNENYSVEHKGAGGETDQQTQPQMQRVKPIEPLVPQQIVTQQMVQIPQQVPQQIQQQMLTQLPQQMVEQPQQIIQQPQQIPRVNLQQMLPPQPQIYPQTQQVQPQISQKELSQQQYDQQKQIQSQQGQQQQLEQQKGFYTQQNAISMPNQTAATAFNQNQIAATVPKTISHNLIPVTNYDSFSVPLNSANIPQRPIVAPSRITLQGEPEPVTKINQNVNQPKPERITNNVTPIQSQNVVTGRTISFEDFENHRNGLDDKGLNVRKKLFQTSSKTNKINLQPSDATAQFQQQKHVVNQLQNQQQIAPVKNPQYYQQQTIPAQSGRQAQQLTTAHAQQPQYLQQIPPQHQQQTLPTQQVRAQQPQYLHQAPPSVQPQQQQQTVPIQQQQKILQPLQPQYLAQPLAAQQQVLQAQQPQYIPQPVPAQQQQPQYQQIATTQHSQPKVQQQIPVTVAQNVTSQIHQQQIAIDRVQNATTQPRPQVSLDQQTAITQPAQNATVSQSKAQVSESQQPKPVQSKPLQTQISENQQQSARAPQKTFEPTHAILLGNNEFIPAKERNRYRSDSPKRFIKPPATLRGVTELLSNAKFDKFLNLPEAGDMPAMRREKMPNNSRRIKICPK